MNFGAHVSISDGLVGAVKEAIDLGCSTFQIFSRNPRGRGKSKFTAEDIAEAEEMREQNGVESFYVHTPYYTNLASPKDKTWKISISSIVSDLRVTDEIGSGFFVTHIGHHMGTGIELGMRRVADALKEINKKDNSSTKILLEITAGQGTEVGNSFEEISKIIELAGLPEEKIGFVLDTAHAFGAGYDLRTKESVAEVVSKMDKAIGLDKLQLIHANDSIPELGSHKDRHGHIGDGQIGDAGFKALVQHPGLQDKDVVIETKHDKVEDDLNKLKSFVK